MERRDRDSEASDRGECSSDDDGIGPPPGRVSLDSRARAARVRSRLFSGSERSTRPTKIGSYVIVTLIGAGGMGEVYLARDERLARDVAIKLIRSDERGLGGRQTERGARLQERLLREARAAAQVSHPNVVQIYEVGVVGSDVFIAMEYVRGKILRAWLDEHNVTTAVGDDDEEERARAVVQMFIDIGRGLAAVHDAGLVHRDFKPDNVLVDVDGRPRITDFGLALDGSEDDEEPRLVGTPRYISPEQLAGESCDARSDQFSYCVALYEALYGVYPFDGPGGVARLMARSGGELCTPLYESAVSSGVYQAIARGLLREPEQRFPHMKALLAALEPVKVRRRWSTRRAVIIAGLMMFFGLLAYTQGSRMLGGLGDFLTQKRVVIPVSSDVATIRILLESARVQLRRWEPTEAMASAGPALERAEALGNRRLHAEALYTVGLIWTLAGDDIGEIERGEAALRRASSLAIEVHQDQLAAQALYQLAVARLGRHGYSTATDDLVAEADAALARAEAAESASKSQLAAHRAHLRGLVAYEASRYDDVMGHCREAVASLDKHTALWDRANYSILRISALLALNHLDAAEWGYRAVRNEVRVFVSVGHFVATAASDSPRPVSDDVRFQHPALMSARIGLARVAVARGELERADASVARLAAAYRRELPVSSRRFAEVAGELSDAWAQRGDRDRARAHADTARQVYHWLGTLALFQGEPQHTILHVKRGLGIGAEIDPEGASAGHLYADLAAAQLAIAAQKEAEGAFEAAAEEETGAVSVPAVASDELRAAEDALSAASRILSDRADNDPSTAARLASLRGRLYLHQWRWPEAASELERSVRLYADVAETTSMTLERANTSWALARALFADGRDRERARVAAEEAQSLYLQLGGRYRADSEAIGHWLDAL